MTRTSKTLRRLCVGAVAAVTVGAGLPVLLATNASAATATTISITPTTQSAATGVCQQFRVNSNSTTQQQVTIVFTDSSATSTTNGTQFDDRSAVFCTESADNSSFTVDANQQNPAVGSGGTTPSTSRTSQTKQLDASGSAVFGIVNRQSERLDIEAFTTQNGSTFNANNDVRASATATFTPGSDTNTPPSNNQRASDNTRTLSEFTQQGQAQAATTAGGSQIIRVLLRNANGDVVAGGTPRFQIQSGGANSSTTTGAPAQSGQCGVSDNEGVATCTVGVTNAGTDQILIFVNQTTGGTTGPDAGEPQLTVTRTTFTAPDTNTANARFVSISPKNTTTQAGTNRIFTATVTNASGRAVQGVQVVFTEDGPGRFVASSPSDQMNGGSVVSADQRFAVATTNNQGIATVIISTAVGESGTEIVTAMISSTGNQTGQAAGQGTNATTNTPAGNNQDSATNFVTAAGTGTQSPGTGTQSPGTGTQSPGTGTQSPGGTNQATGACTVTPTITVNPSTIGAGASSSVTGRVSPNSRVQLFAYSRPSTDFRIARDTVVSTTGSFAFTVALGTNTRLFVQEVGCPSNMNRSVVINVRTVISLAARRNATRNFTFSGQVLPRRGGQLVSLYRRTTRGDILTSQVRTSGTGSYIFVRQFTGNGTFQFFIRTGANLTNVAGVSNVRTLTVS